MSVSQELMNDILANMPEDITAPVAEQADSALDNIVAQAAKDLDGESTNTEATADVAAVSAEAQEKPVEKPAEVKESAVETKRGFERLVKEKKDQREQAQAIRHMERLGKVITPAQAEALERALASGDPLEVMQSMGYTYSQIAAKMVGAPTPKKVEEKPTSTKKFDLPPEIQEKLSLVDELIAERKAQQEQHATNQIMDTIKKAVTADKYKHIATMGDYKGVMGVLSEIYVKHGGYPTDNYMDLIEIAAEEHENRLGLLAKQFEPLYKVQPPAVTSTKTSETSSGSQAQVSGRSKSLNNKMSGPSLTKPKSFDIDDIKKQLLSDPNLKWE